MITPDGKHCTIKGVVVWDGITRPEANDQGKMKHTCKIVIAPTEPDLVDFMGLVNNEFVTGEFKGIMPPAGRFAINDVVAGEFQDMFIGHKVVNAGTYNGTPQVFDLNGQLIPIQQLTNVIYSGAVVELLVNFYSYNNKSKGVACGLAGIRVIDSTLPRLQLGSGINAASVFGAPVAPVAPVAPAPVAPAPVAPAPVAPAPVAPAPVGYIHHQ